MEQVKLPQVSITVVQDPADEAFSPDDLEVKSHMPRPAHLSQKPKPTVLLGALVRREGDGKGSNEQLQREK